MNMELRNSRSQILIRSDSSSPNSSGAAFDSDTYGAFPRQLSNLFSDNVYLSDPWHDDIFLNQPVDDVARSTWRLKDRMKTAGVALVLCLNLGTDPPDVVKPTHSARRECWFDPTGPKQKGLELIGNALQQQYERWQSKAKYKQCLDPTIEDLRRLCINLRKAARNDRLLFHYNGHGVPRPTKNGELWVFGKHYTHYMPVAVAVLRSWLGDPAIYVLDCSGAGALLPHFMDLSPEKEKEIDSLKGPSTSFCHFKSPLATGKGETSTSSFGGSNGSFNSTSTASAAFSSNGINHSQSNIHFSSSSQQAGVDSQTIVLAACRANEILPLSPLYPADLFTCCLTTPIPIALRWFILQNPHSMGDISVDLSENIPGDHSDRKTPRGELHWIFTAVTDTIAWNTLPSNIFQKLFREDLLAASLFRNFLLAKRLMKSLNCTAQSWPPLPDSSTHQLWQTWDLAAESCLFHISFLQRGAPMIDPKNNQPPISSSSTFFSEHLTAFELWLDFGDRGYEAPMHLPILLQVLLSQTHRLRALQLLKRYLALGSYSVNLSLVVGIFPYVLKLLQSPAGEVRQLLVSIWASILGFDPSCRQELVRDKMQGYFIQYLQAKERDMPSAQRCMAAFVLAEICNGYKDGQHSCLQQGLHRTCTGILKSFLDVPPASQLGPPPGMGGPIPGVGIHGPSLRVPSAIPLGDPAQDSNCKVWVALCLFKLCEDFPYAKYLIFTEAGHTQLYPLLQDVDVTVRASSVLALGELFGATSLAPSLADSAHGNKAGLNISTGPHIAQQKSAYMNGSASPNNSRGSMAGGGGTNRGSDPASLGFNSPTPFGVSMNSPTHSQMQNQSNGRETRVPTPAAFGAFGASTMHLEKPQDNQDNGSGIGSTHAMFEGKKVALLSVEQMELLEVELLLATQLLESCTDGSVLVRREAVIALSKFVILPHHITCIKLVANGLLLETQGTKQGSSGKSAGFGSNLGSVSSAQLSGKGPVPQDEAPVSTGPGIGSVSGKGGLASASAPVLTALNARAGEDGAQEVKTSALSDPWQLTLSQSQSIVDSLAQYLACVGYPALSDRNAPSTPSNLNNFPAGPGTYASTTEMRQPIPMLPSQGPNFGGNDGARDWRVTPPAAFPDSKTAGVVQGADESVGDVDIEADAEVFKSVTMARAYVRLWLALSEVKGRDPHPIVGTAAAVVIRRITTHIERDTDRIQRMSDTSVRKGLQSNKSRVFSPSSGRHYMPPDSQNRVSSPVSGPGPHGYSPPFGVGSGKNASFSNVFSVVGNMSADGNGSNPWENGGPMLPGGTAGPSPPPSGDAGRRWAPPPRPGRPVGPSPDPGSTVPGSAASNVFGVGARGAGIISASSLAGINDLPAPGVTPVPWETEVDQIEQEEEPLSYEQEPALMSSLYDWSRKLFLSPAPGYDPYSDPLSDEGCSRLYRDAKLNEILRHEHRLSEVFKYVDDKEDLLQLDRKTKEDLQSAKTTMVSALPSSFTKFEQKAVLNIDTAEVTSLVMFHSIHDILAVSDGYGVGIWSLADGTRIMQISSSGGPGLKPAAAPTYRRHMSSAGDRERDRRERGGSNGSERGSGPEVITSARTPPGLGGISPALGAGLVITTGPLIDGCAGQSLGTAGIASAVAGRTRTGSFSLIPALVAPVSSMEGVARVTAILWVNESYESLLLMGSDDGSVKVWKDSADMETISAHQNGSSNGLNGHFYDQKERDADVREGTRGATQGLYSAPSIPPPSIYGGFYNSSETGTTGASLASAFIALPDVAQDARGSGMVLSWIQPSGTLVAGGNSSTIRVWDVGREQCVRTFNTGLDTCTTAIASRTVGMDFTAASHHGSYYGTSQNYSPSPFRHAGDGAMNLVSWTFAGSADGTVSVFDERASASAVHGGRVHCSRDHSAWIVSAHLRADGVPEVITGSVRGVVKFWDLRSMRTFKTFEVHKSPLTALAVHSCAPVIATGSHAQFIKILTLGGDQLGSIIKYHDGFLGQRIGPVSCLAFHATRMRLAAGATDSIVSIYTTASDM